MKTKFYLTLFLLLSSLTYAAAYGTLTSHDRMYLKWMMESSLEYDEDNLEVLESMLAEDIKNLHAKKFRDLSIKKKLKFFKKYVNDVRFKNYNRLVTFEALALDGSYTVHSCAVYQALVLNHFGVPFAYTQNEFVSTTMIKEGEIYYGLVPPEIKPTTMVTSIPVDADFGAFLTAFGLRTSGKGGLNTLAADKETYYFVDLGRDMKAISANLKVQTGFAYAELQQYNKFFELHRKAYLENGNVKNAFWAWNSFKNFGLPNRKNLTEDDLAIMAKLINSSKEGEENTEVLQVYTFWYVKNTKIGGDRSVLKRDYEYLVANVTHQPSLNQIIREYNVEAAQNAARSDDHEAAVNYLGEVMKAFPEDDFYKRILIEEFLIAVDRANDVDTLRKRFDEFTETYPMVVEHPTYIEAKLRILLIYVVQAYELDEPGRGLVSIDAFEAYRKLHPEVDLVEDLVLNAYGTASRYYSQQFHKKKARELVERGLAVDPNNPGLLYRQKFLQKYQ